MKITVKLLWKSIVIGCAALFFAPQLYAEELPVEIFIPPHQQGVPLINNFVFLDRGSTLGFGTEASKGLSSKVNFRISVESLRDIDDRARKRVNHKFDLKLRSASLFLDWHPFGGSFRTSIGVLINRHRLRVDAVPTQVFSLGVIDLSDIDLSGIDLSNVDLSDIDLPGIDLSEIDLSGIDLSDINLGTIDLSEFSIKASDLLTARGRVRFNDFAPYLGIGWGNTTRPNRRLYYTFDLGVAFHGSPEIELNVRGALADIVRKHAGSELRAFLANEEKRLEDKFKDLDVFPVVSFGLLYRF